VMIIFGGLLVYLHIFIHIFGGLLVYLHIFIHIFGGLLVYLHIFIHIFGGSNIYNSYAIKMKIDMYQLRVKCRCASHHFHFSSSSLLIWSMFKAHNVRWFVYKMNSLNQVGQLSVTPQGAVCAHLILLMPCIREKVPVSYLG